MTIVIVDPSSSGALFLDEFRRLDHHDIVAVISDDAATYYRDAAVRAAAFLPDQHRHRVVGGDVAGVVAAISAAHTVTAVVCGAETGTAVAERLREAFDITPRNTDDRTAARLDKFSAQKTLLYNGIRSIRSDLASSPGDVDASLIAFPAIVKPVASAGSDGVRRVSDTAELSASISDLVGAANALGGDNTAVVVQELIDGDEHIVDGVVDGDEVFITSVCRYEKRWIDGAPVYHQLTWIGAPAADLREYVGSALRALGVRTGSFHMELFDTGGDQRWVMIEVGLRPHGGGHPGYCQQMFGFSQITVEAALAVGGVTVDPDEVTRVLAAPHSYGAVRFLSVDQDVEVVADLAEAVSSIPDVLAVNITAEVGDRLAVTRSLYDTFDIGFVVVSAPSTADRDLALAAVDRAAADCLAGSSSPR